MSVSNTIKTDKATLYREIRTGFIKQDTSLHAWCASENIKMQNARAALLGEWNGPKATTLVERVILASGINRE